MKLYDNLPSGNCYKVRLLLALLSVSYERIDINTSAGESRTPEYQESIWIIVTSSDRGHLVLE